MVDERFDRPLPSSSDPAPEELAIGDAVEVYLGGDKGVVGKLVELADLPTPSGRGIRLARIERARAGERWVFPWQLRRRRP